MDAAGSGGVQEKKRACLAEIIETVNGLLESKVGDDDKLVYVNGVVQGTLAENDRPVEPSVVDSKAQFANSPGLRAALMDAIIEAEEAHGAMSTEAINSESLREGVPDFLLGPGQL